MLKDGHELITEYGENLIEIVFDEGTEAYEKYGEKVGGRLNYLAHGKGEYIPAIIPKEIHLLEGVLGSYGNNVLARLGLIVNPGCKQVYKISDEIETKLKNEGFGVYDIHPDGITVLDQPNRY